MLKNNKSYDIIVKIEKCNTVLTEFKRMCIMFKEVETINPIYTARLDSGVIIFVYEDFAIGTDGERYRPVFIEDENGDWELDGWNIV